MLIGILSDTHDDFLCIKKATEFFNLRKAELVLHCGDIFSPSAAKEFSRLNCGFRAVFGNNDFERAALENVVSVFGCISDGPCEFNLDGKTFAMSHRPFMPYKKKYDYVLCGHTHKPEIKNINGTLFLNPGEACGRRFGRQTAALTDTLTQLSEIFDLDNSGN
jgi:putative phosphoesterase